MKEEQLKIVQKKSDSITWNDIQSFWDEILPADGKKREISPSIMYAKKIAERNKGIFGFKFIISKKALKLLKKELSENNSQVTEFFLPNKISFVDTYTKLLIEIEGQGTEKKKSKKKSRKRLKF